MQDDIITAQEYFKGRGAQINTANRFLKQVYVTEHIEGLDEPLMSNERTKYFYEYPKQIVNKVKSPDLPMMYSMNPYQGCEHGCAYCYARNVHTYWGFSAGLDFERKIIIKPEAPQLLEKTFMQASWQPNTIMLSGNTDCYQPIERKMMLTRKMLEVCLNFRNPVGVISKNSLVLRDKDILQELAKLNLVRVMISLTTLDENLRQLMEPRTATAFKRLQVIEELNAAGIPCGVMTAPTIPGLNSDEIPSLLKAAAERGAIAAGYTLVRLNGDVKEIFRNWLYHNFPDRAAKVWNLIMQCHGGEVNDSKFGRRMRGDGNVAQSIAQLFKLSVKKYFKDNKPAEVNTSLFRRPYGQMSLF